jgi:hypothetical protein
MHFPVEAEDVQIVQGSSGRGLQVRCACGAVNWNHVEIQESLWACRNCERAFTHYFPGLAAKVLAREKAEAATTEPATSAASESAS